MNKELYNKIGCLVSNFYVSVGNDTDENFVKRFNENLEKVTKKLYSLKNKESR
jgi:hypothetical protein